MKTFDWWHGRCTELLQGNQIQSGNYRYTRPAPHVYEYQWLWDSCFHAITYRWFHLEMAQAELRSVVAKQVMDGDDTGMIPHMNYWQPDGMPLWGIADRSIITQPPLIAIAAERVFQKTGDTQFLAELYPSLVAYHEWFDRRRDPDRDDLVSLIHPWEAGCDASPRWDGPLGLQRPTPDQTKAARHALVKTLQAFHCDAQALGEAGHFHVEPLEFNAIRAADLDALAQMARHIGLRDEAAKWEQKADTIRTAVMSKMVTARGCYDLAGLEEQPIKEDSAAKFILLFGKCVDKATAARLVADLESSRYNTPYPVTTTPTDSAAFDPTSYWRGNIWLSVNWLIYTGLRHYGYTQYARHLAQRSLNLVETHGFHEYFNPLTGEGYGPALQSWSTIVLDMLATEENHP